MIKNQVFKLEEDETSNEKQKPSSECLFINNNKSCDPNFCETAFTLNKLFLEFLLAHMDDLHEFIISTEATNDEDDEEEDDTLYDYYDNCEYDYGYTDVDDDEDEDDDDDDDEEEDDDENGDDDDDGEADDDNDEDADDNYDENKGEKDDVSLNHDTTE